MRILLLSLFLLVFTGYAWAQATQYLVTLPDLPLMPGMERVTDSGVVFDKAEGRIVEESVKARNLTPQQIRDFYSKTLPALGWKAAGEQRFLRNGEQLIVTLDKVQDGGLVKFSVSPIEP